MLDNNVIPISWFKSHQDTIQALRKAIYKPISTFAKQPKPQTLYAIYLNGERLQDCPPYSAKEIDKRAKEQKGKEGLLWYIENGYSVKPERK